MTEFKFAILLVAIIALIIGLTSVAVLLSKGDIKSEWPPFISKCPDEYEYNTTATDKCTPKYDAIVTSTSTPTLGEESSCSIFNPAHDDFEGVQGNCNKKKWADACDVSWDGVRGNESLCEDI
tara:strand:+ start:5960 stop:6328 length:369 start_codon:yes stop_codon:yes gene_type:complete